MATSTSSCLKWIDEGLRILVYSKFSSVMGLTSMLKDSVIYPKDVSLRKISEIRGRDVVEFFNIWRNGTVRDMSRQRTPVGRRGIMTRYTPDSNRDTIDLFRAMPVNLEYDVWFWTKSRETWNKVAEEFMFWIHSNPNLDLVLNDTYDLEFDLHFGDRMQDESTVDEQYNLGQLFLINGQIQVDGWIFDDDTLKTVKTIFLKGYHEVEGEDQLLFEETILPETSSFS